VILNKYPYATGHLLIAPNRHIADPQEAAGNESAEMWELMNRAIGILKEKFQPDGFNVGMNLGKSGGAGIADHFHMHVVPRWQGDSNFMPVIGKTRVASYDLEQVYQTIKAAFTKST
jgi:ATP adenylyltransferase